MEVFGKSADKAKRDNDKIGRMFAKMGLLLAAVSEILLLVSELSNEDQIREELLKEALLDSKKKAEDLAEALNMTVIGVKSVEAYSKLNGRTEGIACERSICDYMGVPQFSHSNKLQAKEKELSESIEVKWNLV